VAERRDGRYRYYSLDPAGPTRDALIFLQGLLGSGLSGLRSAVGPLAQPADGPGEAESLG
jgi:ArsR family transcriptional regulator, arsenate/arsenite/antimonite-responsive transcriptional repressor